MNAKKTSFHHILFLIIFLSTGCEKPEEHTYIPPDPPEVLVNERTFAAGYDEVWLALIDYMVEASHAIDNFEKESGLIIITYHVSNIPRLVNCGVWDEEIPYIERDLGFSLAIDMHIRVRAVDAQSTTIEINSSYTLRDSSGNTYTFSEGSSSTVKISGPAPGTPETRTCQSAQYAEKAILDGIEARLTTE